MSEKPELGTCDDFNIPHEYSAMTCKHWEPVASPQATRPHIPIASLDEIASYERPSRAKAEQWADDYLSKPQDFHPPEWQQWLIEKYGLNVRIGESLLAAMFEAYAAQPAAGTTPHVRTYQQADCPKCHERITVEVLGLPSEGTTPQAERQRRVQQEIANGVCHSIDLLHGERGEDARAVAPVETPIGTCDKDLPASRFMFHRRSEGCVNFTPMVTGDSQDAPVETRLTAEQFWLEWIKGKGKHLATKSLSEINCEFAEAFRDKSEAGLREELDQLLIALGCTLGGVESALQVIDAKNAAIEAAEAEAAALRERERELLDTFKELLRVAETTVSEAVDVAEYDAIIARAKTVIATPKQQEPKSLWLWPIEEIKSAMRQFQSAHPGKMPSEVERDRKIMLDNNLALG